MIIISPGVYTKEIDFSLYVPELATAIFGVVSTASKGPTDEMTLITDEGALIGTFGNPSADHLGIYAAIHYLRRGKQLKFVRVADYDVAATGSVRNALSAATAVNMTAVSTGSWGNDITILVSAGTDASTYKFTILYDGGSVEVYDLLKIGAASVDDRNYISTRINGISNYITVSPVVGESDIATSTTAIGMGGGDDGATVDDADYIGAIGTPPTVPPTGLQIFANPEAVDVNVLAVPGISTRAVVSALISLCTSRADCMCLIDIPYGKTVQQAVAWTNGLGGGPTDPTASINSSYAAVFYPWVEVYDGHNNADVWVPPSGHVAGAIAYTDQVSDPWYAIGGLNRGLLADVLDVEHSATQGERDYMYSDGNVVNPIVNFVGQGIAIWGQRTTQRTPSALDRINVRRLLLFMRKAIATAVQSLVFEPNDEDTWAWFRNVVEPICADIKARRGLYDFRVVCDATTNTAAVRNNNQLRGKVMIQPTKTAEMIEVDFIVLNNEAQFSEF